MSEENKQEKIRKVYLDDLPRKYGVGANKEKYVISWTNSIKKLVYFIHDDIKGWIEIIGYNSKNNELTVKYNNKIFNIKAGHFKNCKITKIIGKRNNEFKYNIGDLIDNLNIIDIERRNSKRKDGYINYEKWYKYKCNKCSNEDWIVEGALMSGKRCNACCHTPRKALLGVNTIWDKARWMVDLGVSEEDAKKYTKSSNKKINIICPNCGNMFNKSINKIHSNSSIGCSCGKGFSYPSKIMFSLLKQLNIRFVREFNPKWCKFINYSNDKMRIGKYDFLLEEMSIDDNKIIIEIDGDFHYKNNGLSGQTKEESEYIDNIKDKLALENGYMVVRIDCRKSKLEFIKQNILNSKLNELFDLSKVDWKKCEEFALSNMLNICCELWNTKKYNIDDISNMLQISTKTIRKYLRYASELNKCDYIPPSNIKEHNMKKACALYNKSIELIEISKIIGIKEKQIRVYLKEGNDLGYCNYDVDLENEKSKIRVIKSLGKQIIILKDNINLGVFYSCGELERQSEELFGIKLLRSAISRVATGKVKHYKHFHFKYVQDLTPEEKIKYSIENIAS